MLRHIVVFLFLLISIIGKAHAVNMAERILQFNSNMVINLDASIDVSENITVFANEHKMRHGLIRELPTNYFDSEGIRHPTQYSIQQVLIGHQPAEYHVKNEPNQFIIFVGNRDSTLASGNYTYTIKYRVTNAIDFLQGQDGLYWNVTGSHWNYSIDKANVTITLPQQGNFLYSIGYTGKLLRQEKNFSLVKNANNQLSFSTTAPLSRGESLNIAVSWPKGIVQKPTFVNQIKTHPSYYLSLESTLILFVYYLLVLYGYGRYPRQGSITPVFEPPLNLSPAAIHYVQRMGFDITTFSAAILSMATKGFLTIYNNEGVTLTKKLNNSDNLTDEENLIAETLFAKQTSIKLAENSENKISAAKSKLKKELRDRFQNLYFKNNAIFVFFGIILGLFSFFTILFSIKSSDARFILFWLAIWFIPCILLLMRTLQFFISLFRQFSWKTLSRLSFTVLFAALFFATAIFISYSFINLVPAVTTLLLFINIMINVLFFYLIKVPTPAGQEIMDKIAGFKMYLSTTERFPINKQNPPQKTTDLFDKYLPYAIALGVEKEWGQQFSSILKKDTLRKNSYQPIWFISSLPGVSLDSPLFSSYLKTTLNTALVFSPFIAAPEEESESS